MNDTACDIETGPRPLEELQPIMPLIEAPANWKDPEKIEACKLEKRQKWIDQAALDPMTGTVLAIGYRRAGRSLIELASYLGEPGLLVNFWRYATEARIGRARFCGWNFYGFDLPFLVRRSWMHGIEVPRFARAGRYFNHEVFVDLMDEWSLGNKQDICGLGFAAKALGVGEKNGNGALFYQLLEDDPKAALEYLENDLRMTEAVGVRMGIFHAGTEATAQ